MVSSPGNNDLTKLLLWWGNIEKAVLKFRPQQKLRQGWQMGYIETSRQVSSLEKLRIEGDVYN